MEAIILAGGLGTRLRGVIGEAPKCMAPVNGLPFLEYLFRYLAQEGCTKAILSLGYKHEVVLDWLAQSPPPFEVSYVIETEPLGTGGGIRMAMETAGAAQVFVLNGDTMFSVDLLGMLSAHSTAVSKPETTIALKAMKDFDRYGTVRITDNDLITSFEEKKPMTEGLINGGIYLVERARFLSRQLPERFSFEKDYLEQFMPERAFMAYPADEYFIDIGVPEDYERAQQEFAIIFSPKL